MLLKVETALYNINLPIKDLFIIDDSVVKSKASSTNVYHSYELVHLLLHMFTATLQ